MTARSRTTALAAVLAAGALGLAGCGGSAGSSAPPTGTLITTTPTASAPSSTTTAPPSTTTTTTTAAAPTTATGPTTSNQCQAGSLGASLQPGPSAAGSESAALVLTNTGSVTCTVEGYPGVSYVTGDAGTQVGNPAERTGPAGSVVVLDPGASASALVLFTQVFSYPEATCAPTPVRGLRVYPPNNTDALFVPREGTGCASTDPAVSQLKVQAVTTGVTGGL